LENKREFNLVLASSSAYRQELLRRLHMPFKVAAPNIDETPLAGETGAETAARLARLKANAVAGEFAPALVIGSDQVAECEGLRLDKPGERSKALAQLRWVSGKEAIFHTALALLNTTTAMAQTEVIATRVRFRSLSDPEINRYLDAEPAYDCAGSAKSEGLGISLLDEITGSDPTALIGLPLIALCRMLRNETVPVP
jgi:septum formation protein